MTDWISASLPTTPAIARSAMIRFKARIMGYVPPDYTLCLACNKRKADGPYRIVADQPTPDFMLCEQCALSVVATPQ